MNIDRNKELRYFMGLSIVLFGFLINVFLQNIHSLLDWIVMGILLLIMLVCDIYEINKIKKNFNYFV